MGLELTDHLTKIMVVRNHNSQSEESCGRVQVSQVNNGTNTGRRSGKKVILCELAVMYLDPHLS